MTKPFDRCIKLKYMIRLTPFLSNKVMKLFTSSVEFPLVDTPIGLSSFIDTFLSACLFFLYMYNHPRGKSGGNYR